MNVTASLRLLTLALTAIAAAAPAWAREPITVFAAASLADAMKAVGEAWQDAGGGEVRFALAASSTLARQIEAGAPAHIYASANERWMDHLEARDLLAQGTRVSPIGNRLVLVAPASAGAAAMPFGPTLDLERRLGDGGRLSVGDPAHVPAGLYARQALASLGLWEAMAPRLARADNVRAALALVERGEAPLGIVYATDARISDGVTVVGTFPAESHAPVAYPFAILAGAETPEVEALFTFMTRGAGLAVFEGFGFETR